MGFKKTVTTRIEADWDIAGVMPTVAEWIKIADDMKMHRFAKGAKVSIIPGSQSSMGKVDPARVVIEDLVTEEVSPLTSAPPVTRGKDVRAF
jgi:hypothetical protein